jgi:hypothetical protein
MLFRSTVPVAESARANSIVTESSVCSTGGTVFDPTTPGRPLGVGLLKTRRVGKGSKRRCFYMSLIGEKVCGKRVGRFA